MHYLPSLLSGTSTRDVSFTGGKDASGVRRAHAVLRSASACKAAYWQGTAPSLLSSGLRAFTTCLHCCGAVPAPVAFLSLLAVPHLNRGRRCGTLRSHEASGGGWRRRRVRSVLALKCQLSCSASFAAVFFLLHTCMLPTITRLTWRSALSNVRVRRAWQQA